MPIWWCIALWPIANSARRARTDIGQLASIAEHISTTERDAAEAEIESVKMKKLEFFQQQLDARNPQVFRAVVIDVRNYGLLIELPDVLLTGLVHVSSLTDDFYVFDAARRRLIGRQSRRQFAVGDEMRVFVAGSIDSSARSILLWPRNPAQNDATTKPDHGPKRTPFAAKAFPVNDLPYRMVSRHAEFASISDGTVQIKLRTRGTMDNIIEAKELQIERKHFHVEFRENDRGKFLRITEEAHGRRNTIIVPEHGSG